MLELRPTCENCNKGLPPDSLEACSGGRYSICGWQYCPVSIDPKPKHIMPLELFERVVRQIAPHRPEWVFVRDTFALVTRCRSPRRSGIVDLFRGVED